MGECEEDDVLDGAAMAGAVEWAACWCRVAHLAGGGDVMRDCSLVLRVAGTNTRGNPEFGYTAFILPAIKPPYLAESCREGGEQSPMSKDECLDSASQAGWFLHFGPVCCGTICLVSPRGAVHNVWWARLFCRGPRETGVATEGHKDHMS